MKRAGQEGEHLTGFRNFQLLTLPNGSPLLLGRANKGALGEAVQVLGVSGVSPASLPLLASLGAAGIWVGRVTDPLQTVEEHERVVADELEAFQTEAHEPRRRGLLEHDALVHCATGGKSKRSLKSNTRFPQYP